MHLYDVYRHLKVELKNLLALVKFPPFLSLLALLPLLCLLQNLRKTQGFGVEKSFSPEAYKKPV